MIGCAASPGMLMVAELGTHLSARTG